MLTHSKPRFSALCGDWANHSVNLDPQSDCVASLQRGAFCSMEYIDRILEKLKEWAQELIDALLGPATQPEVEPIPVPVDQPRRRR
ncbi:MAG: hypothetical protein RSE13_21255 [Planktothrix sp. GU0601_MAG3]|nr:MAG: hypothetical protein RSE13_21255 [Planktothrix sp. GU0601_MAG3]